MPGIHVSLPWPIDRVAKLKVQQQQRFVIGGDLSRANTLPVERGAQARPLLRGTGPRPSWMCAGCARYVRIALFALAPVAALASFLGADFPASSWLAHSLPRGRCQQQVNAEYYTIAARVSRTKVRVPPDDWPGRRAVAAARRGERASEPVRHAPKRLCRRKLQSCHFTRQTAVVDRR